MPFGKYKKPKICDVENLLAVSNVLKNVTIICGDFESSESYIKANNLVYLDPPYKPITLTSNFTKYYKIDFGDYEQIRLANYYKRISDIGAKVILSNSDVRDSNVGLDNKDFFDNLYKNFNISRINVSRMVSAKAISRKKVKELIIDNMC